MRAPVQAVVAMSGKAALTDGYARHAVVTGSATLSGTLRGVFPDPLPGRRGLVHGVTDIAAVAPQGRMHDGRLVGLGHLRECASGNPAAS